MPTNYWCNSDVQSEQKFCVWSDTVGDDVAFTVFSAADGYASLGIGSQMAGGDMYTAWKNSSGGYIISRRLFTGRELGDFDANRQIARITNLRYGTDAKFNWAKLTYTFRRPIKDENYDITESTSFMWANGKQAPTPPSSANASYAAHGSDYGVIRGLNIFESYTDRLERLKGTHTNNNLNQACVPNTICVYGKPQDKNMIFTIHSAYEGWASIGLGDKMSNSDFYLGWKNSTGGYTISRRATNGRVMPTFSLSQIAQILPLQVPAPVWAKLAFSFSRPIEADSKISSTSNFIWGVASKAPSAIDDPRSNFDDHDNYGTLPQVNFLSTTVRSVSGTSSSAAVIKPTRSQYQTILMAHGALFFIAWFLTPLVAIFIARYLKENLGVWWYKLHWGLMTFITGGLASIGFLLVFLYKPSPHFDDPHSIIGLFMLIVTWAQIALGFVINALWTPTRTSIPWRDKMHWWFGRAIFIFGIANIFLGLKSYHELSFPIALNAIYIGFGALVGLGVLLLAYGEIALGQTHDMASDLPNETRMSEYEFDSQYKRRKVDSLSPKYFY